MNSRTTPRAFLVADVVGALALVALMAALFAVAVQRYARSREYVDARRLARLTAETELHALRAGLKRAPDAETSEWLPTEYPGVELMTARSPGENSWEGFTRLTVSARRHITSVGWVRVDLSAYIVLAEAPP